MKWISLTCQFGYGGANAHVILQDAASLVKSTEAKAATDGYHSTEHEQGLGLPIPANRPYLLTFSASAPSSLQAYLERLKNHRLEQYKLRDLSFTLGARRSLLRSRAFTVTKEDTLAQALETPALQISKTAADRSVRSLVFIFTGQGAQWPRMARELLKHNAIFRSSIYEQDRTLCGLDPNPKWTLKGTQ